MILIFFFFRSFKHRDNFLAEDIDILWPKLEFQYEILLYLALNTGMENFSSKLVEFSPGLAFYARTYDNTDLQRAVVSRVRPAHVYN